MRATMNLGRIFTFLSVCRDFFEIFDIIFCLSVARVENNVENVKMSLNKHNKSKKVDPNSLLPNLTNLFNYLTSLKVDRIFCDILLIFLLKA